MIRFVFVLCRRGRKYDVQVREVGSGGHKVAASLVPE